MSASFDDSHDLESLGIGNLISSKRMYVQFLQDVACEVEISRKHGIILSRNEKVVVDQFNHLSKKSVLWLQ